MTDYEYRVPPGLAFIILRPGLETHLKAKILAPLYVTRPLRVKVERVRLARTPSVRMKDAVNADYAMYNNMCYAQTHHVPNDLADKTLSEDELRKYSEYIRRNTRALHTFGITINQDGFAPGIVDQVIQIQFTIMHDGEDITGKVMWLQSPMMGEPIDEIGTCHTIFSLTWEKPGTPFTFQPRRTNTLPPAKHPQPQPTPEGGEQMKDQKKDAPPPFIRAVVVRDSEHEFAEGDSLESKRYLRAYLEPAERTDNGLRTPKSGEQVRFLVNQEGKGLDQVVEAKIDPRSGKLVAKVEINDEPIEWAVASPSGQPQRIREVHGEWPEKTNPSIQFAPTEPSGSATASGGFQELGPDDLPPPEAPPLRLQTSAAVRMVTPSMVEQAPAARARPEPEPPAPLARYDDPPKAPKIDASSSLAWDESKTNPQGWKVQQELIQKSLEGEAMPPPTAPAAPEVRQSAPPPPPPPPPPPAIEDPAPADGASNPHQPQPPPIPAEEPKEQVMTQKEQPPTRTVAASEVIPPKPAPAPAPTVAVNVVQPPQAAAAAVAKGGGLGELGLYAAKVAIALVIAAAVIVIAMVAYDRLVSDKDKPKESGKAAESADAGKTGVLEPPTSGFGDERDDQRTNADLKPGDICYVISTGNRLVEIAEWRKTEPRPAVSVDKETKRPLVRIEHRNGGGDPMVARWTKDWDIDCENLLEIKDARAR